MMDGLNHPHGESSHQFLAAPQCTLQNDDKAGNAQQQHPPGARCKGCGYEIVDSVFHPLPNPKNHRKSEPAASCEAAGSLIGIIRRWPASPRHRGL